MNRGYVIDGPCEGQRFDSEHDAFVVPAPPSLVPLPGGGFCEAQSMPTPDLPTLTYHWQPIDEGRGVWTLRPAWRLGAILEHEAFYYAESRVPGLRDFAEAQVRRRIHREAELRGYHGTTPPVLSEGWHEGWPGQVRSLRGRARGVEWLADQSGSGKMKAAPDHQGEEKT